MIEIYKTINNELVKLEKIEKHSWLNVTDPSEEELLMLINDYGIDSSFLRSALDEEESSRIESEDNQTLIVIDVPLAEKDGNAVIYSTIPLSIILANDCVITVSTKEIAAISDITEGVVKNINTQLKTRFILQIFYRVAQKYLQFLKHIDRLSSYVEKKLHKSMKNQELIQLLDLEKSLVFFSTSLRSDEITMEKILRGRFIKLYDEDQELLQDVLIEIKQAIEMCNIYSSILSGTMDAFASVISNNLNIVMKVLTSITILMAIPTMVASFFGMNVSGIPYPSFWFPLVLSGVATGLVFVLLRKKGMF